MLNEYTSPTENITIETIDFAVSIIIAFYCNISDSHDKIYRACKLGVMNFLSHNFYDSKFIFCKIVSAQRK